MQAPLWSAYLGSRCQQPRWTQTRPWWQSLVRMASWRAQLCIHPMRPPPSAVLGMSPFLRQHPPPHMLLGSFLQLCRVTSMPGCNQDLGRDPASLISWANLFRKEPAGFRAARTKAFSSAKQASERLPISCCNSSWCQVVFESQRFIIQDHIKTMANRICDEKKNSL